MGTKPAMKDLQTVARELNEVVKPDPPIRYVGVKANDVLSDIKTACGLLVKGDKISKESSDILASLSIEHVATLKDNGGKHPPAAPKEKKVSNLDLMKSLVAGGATDAKIKKAFLERYEGKEEAFVDKRVAIYKRLAGGKSAE